MTNDELNKLIERFEDLDDGISIEESHKLICGLINREKEYKKSHTDFYQLIKNSLISTGKNMPSDFMVIDALVNEYEAICENEILKSRASQFEATLKETLEERNKLQDENTRLKRIIAHEFNENDDLGSEFVYVTILKDQIKVLNEKLKIATEALEEIKNKMPSCDCMDAPGLAREALEKLKGELK